MNIKRLIGLDIAADDYRYTVDPDVGFVSAKKAPDHWVATTCGYCSVGCGMFIGVKDGCAVSVRGNPDHPANRGWLCPKGLSEHHTLDAPNRAAFPDVGHALRAVELRAHTRPSSFRNRLRAIHRKIRPPCRIAASPSC